MAWFILDFYCAGLHLAIGLDGNVHRDQDQEEYDRFRTETLNALGIRVLRFWDHDVLTRPEWVLEEINRVAMTIQQVHS